MHHAFTGSTRKTRQVNLSGRQNSNPWAALPGSPKSSHGSPATHSTVAQAQADRQRRQHEREKVIASKKVQQTWRGHESRRRQKEHWRQEWDKREEDRLRSSNNTSFKDILTDGSTAPAYASADLALSQLRLLVHFQEFRRHRVRIEQDTLRLLYFADALQASIKDSSAVNLSPQWKHNLARLGTITAKHLRSVRIGSDSTMDHSTLRLATLLVFLSSLIPEELCRESHLYMQVLGDMIDAQVSLQETALVTMTALLSTSAGRLQFYNAFVAEILCNDKLSQHQSLLKKLSADVDLVVMAKTMLSIGQEGQRRINMKTGPYLWAVSYLIWINRQNQYRASEASNFHIIQAVSALLGLCANDVADRWELEDVPMADGLHKSGLPLPAFVQENLASLVQQDTVRKAITDLSDQPLQQNGAASMSDLDAAKHLADYSVAMLRAFPNKAANIRMWLYQGSIKSATGKAISTIQYLWSATCKTGVFRRITKDHRSVLSVLTEAAPDDHQIGRPALSQQDVDLWMEEWRITLLFLELYTFVLKLMDDDDFFSLDKTRSFGYTESSTEYSQFRKGALPLTEVASLTTFLKNLAFTLYWNVAELTDTADPADASNVAALLGATTGPVQTSSKSTRQTLTGNGVSHGYMKGLATGLLRMIHDRDSRRPFLPKNHWLMTSQIDLTGFIPAVVAEEEKRHEIGYDDDEEEVLEDVANDADLANARDGFAPPSTLMQSMFNIRQPHIPRSNASSAGIVEKQQRQASKKRLLESLAPRLEILRNLPFFIPFETRVRIFREFVYRDQLRRRDGLIDADQWRMNLASITQGRDINGRPRSMDRITRQHAEIHRDSVFEDAYASYYPIGDALKEPIQISFIDKFGAPEAGIDGGGVTKEFLMSVTAEALDPNQRLNMFQENEQRYLYPNPTVFDEVSEGIKQFAQKGTENYTYHMRDFLRRFEFIGRVIGKCLYEGILIDVNFAGFFLLKWALTGGTTSASSETAYRASINDLRQYDEALYQGLLKLKNYTGDVESDLGLNFTVTDTVTISSPTRTNPNAERTQSITRDLIPNGATTPVTSLNRHLYIDRIVRYRLQQQPQLITNAFLRGLGQIIQPMWLAMFNQKELQHLVGGDNAELDIADLRRNTQYSGLYVVGDDGEEHPTVQLFWKALQSMDDADRRKVVKFVTSTPRAPLLGFSHLNPKFSIRDSSEDQTRLPSTSTCVNLLKLPRYGDAETMRKKLLYAVNAGAGFDLS